MKKKKKGGLFLREGSSNGLLAISREAETGKKRTRMKKQY